MDFCTMISYISISLLLLLSCLQPSNCLSVHRLSDHHPDHQPPIASDNHPTQIFSENDDSWSLNVENREDLDPNRETLDLHIRSMADTLLHTPMIPIANPATHDVVEKNVQFSKGELRKRTGAVNHQDENIHPLNYDLVKQELSLPSSKDERRTSDRSEASDHEEEAEESRFVIKHLIDTPSMNSSSALLAGQPSFEKLRKSNSPTSDSRSNLRAPKNSTSHSNTATPLQKPMLISRNLPVQMINLWNTKVPPNMMNENFAYKQRRIRKHRIPRHVAPNYGTPSVDQGNPLLSPACESVTQWIQLDQAEDFEGNTVLVLDHAEPGIKQFFLETTCKRSHSVRHQQNPAARRSQVVEGSQEDLGRCTGVDHAKYESICHEGHGYTYAKVIDPTFLAGSRAEWRLIKIRTSCSCSVVKRLGHRLSY